MNQSRSRKMSAAGELGRSRLSKNSGDVTKSMTRDGTKDSKEHFKPQQQHSKTRIPKDIRYDLENALVGLCDVWFEEIKPYLLRNNVKLHVQCEGGDEAAAGGDRGPIPHASPGRHPSSQVSPGCHPCSHVDPASTAPRCELCRLLFSAASSIDDAIAQASSAALQASGEAATPTDKLIGESTKL
ncbi:hypothetical protein NE865_11690 [Phthorimaea operculella]|nr:hypothetical protein NE865_11690 [Phthorimaea operculella]